MRKTGATLAVTLGLCLGLSAQAGEPGAGATRTARRADSGRIQQVATARQVVGGHSGWLQVVYVLQVVTTPISYGTNGIIDEPDPTSARDRARNPGFGYSGGGTKQRRDDQDDQTRSDEPSGAVQLGTKK